VITLLVSIAIHTGTRLRRLHGLILLSLLLLTVPGCALGVMAGKMFFGDPKLTAEFRKASGVDLTEGDHQVLIICSAPHGIRSDYPSLEIDIVDRMTRILETRGIKLISADDVASWYDDQGEWGDFSELAQYFEADYVLHVDIQKFSYLVPDSSNLLQGKAEGRITAFQSSANAATATRTAFDRMFKITYPPTYPVPRENRSDDIFVQGFMDRVALHLAQFMYDHRASESVSL
jgi:hypothetical protein